MESLLLRSNQAPECSHPGHTDTMPLVKPMENPPVDNQQHLKTMSSAELRELQSKVDGALEGLFEKDRKEFGAKFEELAAAHGMTSAQALGALTKSSSAKTPSQVKYVDTTNSSNTWSGRGRQPNWFRTRIESGIKPEDMLA